MVIEPLSDVTAECGVNAVVFVPDVASGSVIIVVSSVLKILGCTVVET